MLRYGSLSSFFAGALGPPWIFMCGCSHIVSIFIVCPGQRNSSQEHPVKMPSRAWGSSFSAFDQTSQGATSARSARPSRPVPEVLDTEEDLEEVMAAIASSEEEERKKKEAYAQAALYGSPPRGNASAAVSALTGRGRGGSRDRGTAGHRKVGQTGDDTVAVTCPRSLCGKTVFVPKGFDLALVECPHCRQGLG